MQPTTRPERAALRKAAAERRDAKRLWRRRMLTRVAAGESRVEIAAEQGMTLKALQRALEQAANDCPIENLTLHRALQFERVQRALRLADARIGAGDINGVYAMTKLLPLMLQYDNFERETLATPAE